MSRTQIDRRQLGSLIGTRGKPVELAKVIDTAATATEKDSDWWRAAELDGLALGLRSRHAELQLSPTRGTLVMLLVRHDGIYLAADSRRGEHENDAEKLV